MATKEIDLKNPKSNLIMRVYTTRTDKNDRALEAGFVDTSVICIRIKKGLIPGGLTFSKAREKNVGWRIDYFLYRNGFKEQIQDALILFRNHGSDHCPVGLEIEFVGFAIKLWLVRTYMKGG